MKRIVRVSAIAAIAGALLVVAFCGPSILRRPRTLVVRAYFADALNLRAGAPVRIAGVNVGSVTSVTVDTIRKQNPALVRIRLNTDYDLSLPRDAVVSVESSGILGEPFASIRIDHASGPPIQNGGELPSERTQQSDLLNVDCTTKGQQTTINLRRPDDKSPPSR